jgi:hypothetical protein
MMPEPGLLADAGLPKERHLSHTTFDPTAKEKL